MLFETSNKQIAGRAAPVPLQQAPGFRGNNTGNRNPHISSTTAASPRVKPVIGYNSGVQRPVKSIGANPVLPQKNTGVSFAGQQKKQIKGWPSYQQAAKQSQASRVKPAMPSQKPNAGASAISGQNKKVKGWPSHQQAVAPRVTPMVNMKRPVKGGASRPGLQRLPHTSTYRPTQKGYGGGVVSQARQKVLPGWGSYRQGMQSPRAFGATIPVQKTMNAPVSIQPGQTAFTGRRFYDARTKRYFNYTGNKTQRPTYTTLPDAPSAQSTVTGWPSNAGYNVTQQPSQSCDCSRCAHKPESPVSVAAPYSPAAQVPVQQVPRQQAVPQPVCPTCGLNTNGCTTLSGFALNSSLLNAYHKKQLKNLAASILQQNSNAVVATGHTNSSKTEELIENLGERRALTVISELKRQLSKLKPGAQKNIFWKTVSKAITQPEVSNHSGNRRVEICIRQLR